jgi:hypothetical protein
MPSIDYFEDEVAFEKANRAKSDARKADSAPPAEVDVAKTFSGFMSNLKGDAIDVGKGLIYPITNWDEFSDGMVDLVTDDNGDFHTGELIEAGGQIVDRYKEIANDPGQSLYDRPLSTAMDIASLAFPVRGAAKFLPDGSTAQKVTEGAANVIQNMDPVSMVTTGGAALNAAVTNPQKLTEGVIKPSNGRTHREADQGYRQEVMNSALEREITPSKAGMQRLDEQISVVGQQIDELLVNSPVTINMPKLVDGFENWAKAQVDQTDNNYAAIRSKIEAKQAQIKSQYGTTPEGDAIVGINGEGLRSMRQSADRDVNHNRVTQQNDSAQVTVDKLYANYLREQLAANIDGIGELNAEMSTLLKIDDMYGPAYNRLSQNNPVGLGTVAGVSGGASSVGYGLATGEPLATAAGAAAVMGPFINNPTVRGARAGSAYRSRRAGGGNNPVSGAVGALARDRNNVPFYLRQGGSFVEAMNQELMRQEDER